MAWRLLLDVASPASGAWNMSVDEALLGSLRQGLAPVTLRFYRWSPPTVSLGYFQPAEDVDLEALARLGLGLVRRPTGGRAILHDDELTYSLTIPAADVPGGRSVGRSYLAISRGLLAGLELLGLRASVGHDKSTRSTLSAGCFALSTRADLTAAGHKIIGSAQTRRGGVILQHGAVPITLDADKHRAVFGPQEAEAVLAAGGGLVDVLGYRPSWQQLVQAFVAGFRQAFDVDIVAGELTDAERELAARLESERYGTEDFTLHCPAPVGTSGT
ncbi:MAG: lipoate--protein ligase family protein [Armatimonadetes bacterium]|nr:lipoate--protein ligase family protein [Armatimonadota bacterium]